MEDNNVNSRLLMAVTVQGVINADDTIQLEALLGTLPGDQKVSIQRGPNDKYTAGFSGGVSLKRIASQ